MMCGAGAPPSSKGVVRTPDHAGPEGITPCTAVYSQAPACLQPCPTPPGSRACQPSGFRGDLVIWIPAGVKEGHQEATSGCRHFMPA